LERVKGRIAHAGGSSIDVTADVSNLEDNLRLVESTIAAFGRLDIAFLNAGVLGPMSGLSSIDAGVFDKIIRTNLYGCFYGIKAAEKSMENGGAIVVTASIAGLQGLAESPAYAASKHGILGLVKSSAASLAKKGIRINAICPGGVATPMAGIPQTDELQAPDELVAPEFRGMSSAQQIAEVALFLASPRASAMTGGCYVVDAGWTSVISAPAAEIG
jgi:NAD(P)-dependent dehydrogenase (short-subunit alcohol dehydrogenase family)